MSFQNGVLLPLSVGVVQGTIFEVGLLLLSVGVLKGTIFEVGLLLLSVWKLYCKL